MITKEKIKKTQFQTNKVNQVIPKINKYFINYCKALKEIWKLKIDKHKDFKILESYNLGTAIGNDCSNNYYNFEAPKFVWNSKIKELDKIYRQCLK